MESPKPPSRKMSFRSLFNEYFRQLGLATGLTLLATVGALSISIVAVLTLFAISLTQDPVPEYVQGYYETIQDPVNASQTMQLTTNLYSTTFGAQSHITIYARLEPSQEMRNNNANEGIPVPESYRIWFDGTYCKLTEDKYERIFPCWFDLTKDPQDATSWDRVVYKANHPMNYTYSGTFGVALGVGATDEEDRIHSKAPFIHIESVEATNAFKDALRSRLLSQVSLLVSSIALILTLGSVLFKGLRHPVFDLLRADSKKKGTADPTHDTT